MSRAGAYPCVIVKGNKNSIDGLIIIQLDKALGFGTEQFLDKEKWPQKYSDVNTAHKYIQKLHHSRELISDAKNQNQAPRSTLSLTKQIKLTN